MKKSEKLDMFRDIDILMSEFNKYLSEAINYVAVKNNITPFRLGIWYADYTETRNISNS